MNCTRSLALLSAALYLIATVSPGNASADERDRCSEVAKAGRALVTVTSDANCKLTINGEAKGTLTANQPRDVEAAGGKQVIDCASTEVSGAATQDTLLLGGGCGSMTFEVAQAWHRFTADKGGAVADADTGLRWIQSDNGADIDWNGAKQYCAGKSGRLPTEKELSQLHTGGAVRVKCGEYSCMLSHLFRLSGRFLWSSSPFETDQAIIIGFAGQRPAVQSVKQSVAKDARALCVSAAK